MESQSQKNTSGNRYYYYRCYAPYRSGLCDFRYNINEKALENYIIDNLDELIKIYASENAYLSEISQQKQIDVEKYQNELNRLNNAYIKGRIEEDYYDAEYERLKGQAEARYRELVAQGGSAALSSSDEFGGGIIKANDSFERKEKPKKSIDDLKSVFTDDWKTKYLVLERKEKRAVWKKLINKIELNSDKSIKMVHFK